MILLQNEQQCILLFVIFIVRDYYVCSLRKRLFRWIQRFSCHDNWLVFVSSWKCFMSSGTFHISLLLFPITLLRPIAAISDTVILNCHRRFYRRMAFIIFEFYVFHFEVIYAFYFRIQPELRKWEGFLDNCSFLPDQNGYCKCEHLRACARILLLSSQLPAQPCGAVMNMMQC